MDKGVLKIIQVYAPQQGRTAPEKEFYQTLQDEMDLTSGDTVFMGDLNGHVGVDRDGYNNVVGAFGIGDRNREWERLLDFCVLNNLAIMNTKTSTSGHGIAGIMRQEYTYIKVEWYKFRDGIEKTCEDVKEAKSFDRVPRDQLWQAIEHDEYEVPVSLIKAIKSLYENSESRVKTEKRCTDLKERLDRLSYCCPQKEKPAYFDQRHIVEIIHSCDSITARQIQEAEDTTMYNDTPL
ncbi:uncharacterized protein LOC143024379 [Oratosquilla oratoria]|uniref:uncharacterized protein LOC143024379 n=1 Tax=Oratosquilla oratoria TaxID=337810 RepID=UPI003F76E46E